MIRVSNLLKKYGNNQVINNINLEIRDHEFLVILGPSGCGKTTFLRILSGLEEITEGEILIDDKSVNKVPPKDRNISMVFQNYALFPDMTVYQNIAFGLQIQKMKKDKIKDIVNDISLKLKIEKLLKRKPSQLSGGEQQRVALARAMVKKPNIYLFDEPLSNLDVNLKDEFMNLIKNIHKETNATFVYVTHSQNEALKLADRIVVMNEGNIIQIGTPKDLYNSPNSIFVSKFLGEPKINIMDVKDSNYKLGIRPEDIKCVNESDELGLTFKTNIIDREFLGNGYLYSLEFSNQIINMFSLNQINCNEICCSIKYEKIIVFNENDNNIPFDNQKITIVKNEFLIGD